MSAIEGIKLCCCRGLDISLKDTALAVYLHPQSFGKAVGCVLGLGDITSLIDSCPTRVSLTLGSVACEVVNFFPSLGLFDRTGTYLLPFIGTLHVDLLTKDNEVAKRLGKHEDSVEGWANWFEMYAWFVSRMVVVLMGSSDNPILKAVRVVWSMCWVLISLDAALPILGFLSVCAQRTAIYDQLSSGDEWLVGAFELPSVFALSVTGPILMNSVLVTFANFPWGVVAVVVCWLRMLWWR